MCDDLPPDYSIVCSEAAEAATPVGGDRILPPDQLDPLSRLQLRIARRADSLACWQQISAGPAADLATWRLAETETFRHLDSLFY